MLYVPKAYNIIEKKKRNKYKDNETDINIPKK